MTRGLGVDAALAERLEPVEPLLALLTQLGDAWFLVALGVGLYWLGPRAPLAGWTRRRGLVVFGVALWAVATAYVLQIAFGLPRPPGAGEPAYTVGGLAGVIYADAATATGCGFPSGHAVAVAAVYPALVRLGGGNGGYRRWGAAAGLIALVAVTRVGLGVHYVVDVVVGVAVGLGLAAVAVGLSARPGLVLGLATATAGIRAGIAPVDPTTAALVGLSAGALVAWWWPGGAQFGRDGADASDPVWLAVGVALLGAPALGWLGATSAGVGLGAAGAGLAAVALPGAVRVGEK